ncbi:LrgB family protein [Marinivivus vitaminiproducens]|uniref:LrgB family protein n=1 Tax=Marinivivus vitaminiproducens TaxID=3035935 RepID=UPI00279AF541|nr:LrgB family protein [Geminicoccaceae bacterium SCSIO 64248]
MPTADPLLSAAFWSVATILVYAAAKALHRRCPAWYASPLIAAPAVLIAAAWTLHTGYREYIQGTHWLMTLLGPVTVAFAIPIYQQRTLIVRHWPVLLAGVIAGSGTSMLTAWALASALGVDGALRLSLLPRSMSTPFAMTVSDGIGGVPDLTAVFVVVTGVLGAALGEVLLHWLPLRSTLARGALLGMGAHGAGVARAHRIGREEGSTAGLVMIMVGLCNVLLAPVLAACLR